MYVNRIAVNPSAPFAQEIQVDFYTVCTGLVNIFYHTICIVHLDDWVAIVNQAQVSSMREIDAQCRARIKEQVVSHECSTFAIFRAKRKSAGRRRQVVADES